MINNISNALNAYQQALGRINANTQVQKTDTPATTSANAFSDMVKSAVEETANINQQAEQAVIQGIQGKADIQDVVLAVSNAETALQTVVAVRDTAIKAYNTIMQMPI